MKKIIIACFSLVASLFAVTGLAEADVIPYSQSNNTNINVEFPRRFNVPIVNPFNPNNKKSTIGSSGAKGINNNPKELDYVPKTLDFKTYTGIDSLDLPLSADDNGKNGTSFSSPDNNGSKFVFVQMHDFPKKGMMDLKAYMDKPFTNSNGQQIKGAYFSLSNTQEFEYNLGKIIYNQKVVPNAVNVGNKEITTDQNAPVLLTNNGNQSITGEKGTYGLYALAWDLNDFRVKSPANQSFKVGANKADNQYNTTINWNYSPRAQS